jgi:hypothetical protein
MTSPVLRPTPTRKTSATVGSEPVSPLPGPVESEDGTLATRDGRHGGMSDLDPLTVYYDSPDSVHGDEDERVVFAIAEVDTVPRLSHQGGLDAHFVVGVYDDLRETRRFVGRVGERKPTS